MKKNPPHPWNRMTKWCTGGAGSLQLKNTSLREIKSAAHGRLNH